MRLAFLDRHDECIRIRRRLQSEHAALIIVYGQRRCGKSRMLQEAIDPGRHVYFLADQREERLQRHALATEISRLVPGFASVEYPDWPTLFESWGERSPSGGCLILDEFPYLVQSSPALPSILQRLIDLPVEKPWRLILCGSSQRMMQGLVLDRTAPLYGRADEILKLEPLEPRWIKEALGVNNARAIEAYATWGGIPANWELAKGFRRHEEAVKQLILNRNGVLHRVPERLLTDDMRSAVQPHSILTLIGAGCHRPSEIAARLAKPASSLSRPLGVLCELGYVRREQPFGMPARSSKKTPYRIADPFLRFWYRFIAPNESRLAMDLIDVVYETIQQEYRDHVAGVWEDMARLSVPRLPIHDLQWGPASRWWGKGVDGSQIEIDVVAESLDGKHLLIGEAKWGEGVSSKRLADGLRERAMRLPWVRGRKLHWALWLKRGAGQAANVATLTPSQLLE